MATEITNGNFTQSLTYSNGTAGFNGNITGMNWTTNGSSHSYAFTYDGVNRMLNATHGTGAYTEKVTDYDKNGNITGLQRYNSSLVDNLTYTYNGNQLTKVEDSSSNAFGFANGSTAATEYYYDNNGNLTKDLNKNISNIQYNSLNLPSVVTFGDGSTITYTYAADGRKLKTVHVIGNTTTQTDYCGNVIYENGTAKLLLTEAGYVDLSDNSYHYYIKDHLGNNRVVADANGTVEESNQYYPFGLSYANSSANLQPYKYNGKELDTKNGLNWYDYGARHYDAALGSWFIIDPLAEKYSLISPYVYCNNNPILYIDPNGEDWKDAWETFKRATTVNLSIGLQAGIEIGSIGLKANMGSFQISNKEEPKITTGASIGLGIIETEYFDNVYKSNDNVEIKETGVSISIPYIAEETYSQKEYYNEQHEKVKTEKKVDKELATTIDVSTSFIVGFDVSINWDEINTIISDFLK